MKFKEGDKVVFLNEKGGGIVTRVVDEEIVHVSIEDGFEIPYAWATCSKRVMRRRHRHRGARSRQQMPPNKAV